MHLILASASEGRKELLSYLKIPFEIIPSSIDEDKVIGKTPLETIKLRARRKAEDVAFSSSSSPKLLKPLKKDQETIILSADSGAILDGELIGRPKDYEDAVRILSTLSGKTHEFITAIYLSQLSDLKVYEDYDTSFVTFRRLSKDHIRRYLSITNYTRFAGGYAIASAQDFITKIEGSISNVIGLPLEKVIPILCKLRTEKTQ